MKRRFAYIASASRTPIGIYNGGLASLTAPKLGGLAAMGCFDRCPSVPKDAVNECIFGNVLSANVGQNPSRQVSRAIGLKDSVPCTTINKVCSSGLKAVCYGAQSIELGDAHVVLSGGMESMSNVPYYSAKTRFGARMGDVTLIDGMIRDGLADAWDGTEMGVYGDRLGVDYSITRSKQDDFAIESYQRAQMAYPRNIFDTELVSVEVPNAKKKDNLQLSSIKMKDAGN